MEFTFLKHDGNVAFVRDDAEQAEWTQEEMNLNCTFPYNGKKVIERGMTVLFQDPATDAYQAYEIRNCQSFAAEGYQVFTAEDIAISELTDCHIPEKIEFTDISVKNALTNVLQGTGWAVGSVVNSVSSGDVGRGDVWQAVCSIRDNWNVYIMPRVTVDASGIVARYLDIIPAEGTWRGVRLSVNKNLDDPCVQYDDSELYTALFAYGGTYTAGEGDSSETREYNIKDVTWTKTDDHPAKPKGQNFIEWPEKTALYGRNGKPRYGYYQNGDIDDPNVLIQKAWESLKQCADPKISIKGTVTDLKRLGYTDQPIRLHDMAIVELEPLGVQFYKQIIQLTVDLLNPDNTVPNIGNYIPNIIYINRQTDDDATGGGRGRGGGTRAKQEFSQYITEIEKNERDIQLYARKVDEQGNILQQAGMSIDPETGVIIYAEDNEHNIGSMFHAQSNMIESEVRMRIQGEQEIYSNITQTANQIRTEVSSSVTNLQSAITQQANRISLVVEGTGKNAKIKAAQIVASINDGASTIKLKADHIDIDGLVSALEAESLVVGDLESNGSVEADPDITAGGTVSGLVGSFSELIANDREASWQSATVVTAVERSNSRYFVYAQNGNISNLATMIGTLVTGVTSDAIYYLGR